MPHFVDTNLLVYARDESEGAKHTTALAWLRYLWRSRQGRLSWQVLQEFYVTVTQKLSPGLERAEARGDIRDLSMWRPVAITTPIVEAAWLLQDRHSISFWDALIVAAAEAAGCDHVLTEDLSDGELFGAVTIVNPFLHSPPPDPLQPT